MTPPEDTRPPSLQARWEAKFPRPAVAPPLPADFSPWGVRERALQDLRALPALAQRIREAYRACRQAQSLAARGPERHRQAHLDEARERFFDACVLAQPVVAPHVPPAWSPCLWDEVRHVVVEVADQDAAPATDPAPLFA